MKGQHNLKPNGERMKNQLLRRYKESAIARNHVFELTTEEFEQLTQGNCYYCGIEPQQIYKGTPTGGDYIYNGVDRVDNTKGYVIDNVVTCCGVCNIAKRNLTQEQFLQWIKRLSGNLIAKGLLT